MKSTQRATREKAAREVDELKNRVDEHMREQTAGLSKKIRYVCV